MIRVVFGFALMLITNSNSFAQFTASPGGSWPEFPLECGIVSLNPKDNDPDPIYKIIITLIFDKTAGRVQELDVHHWSVDGKRYTRSEQYLYGQLETVPGKLGVTWQGSWRKNTNVRMTGRLWANNGRWYYTEEQTKYGSLSLRMNAICHQIGGME